MQATRIEHHTLGDVAVPAARLWSAQSQHEPREPHPARTPNPEPDVPTPPLDEPDAGPPDPHVPPTLSRPR